MFESSRKYYAQTNTNQETSQNQMSFKEKIQKQGVL